MKVNGRGPPRIPFVLCVGVTGHRSEALAEGGSETLKNRIRGALELIDESAADLREPIPDCFAPGPVIRRLVSPLADGTDQLAAEVALELGWEVHALFPFNRAAYRSTLSTAESRASFDRLMNHATAVLELPGDLDRAADAYALAGRATVAHSDLLLAIWDGKPARGRGGTADVVQLALTHGTAVLHLHSERPEESRILWSAFDPNVVTTRDEPAAVRPLARAGLEAALRGLLVPPEDPAERQFIRRFDRERLRRIRTRIEYPLMLALAGVSRFGAKDFREDHCAAMIREEWRRHREGCADPHGMAAANGLLEDSYSWADRLATHFAQTYRSGHIFGFVLGGIAVCIGLSAFMAPDHKFALAAVELLITVAIILNAIVGTRNEWHRRWLDYRQLAERLRPMRSLALLAIAAPDPPGSATNPVPRRWIDWYAGGIWRAIGAPCGRLDPSQTLRLATAIADHEVAPQVGYHKRNAVQIEHLDRRLERIGLALFIATLVVSVMTMIAEGIGDHEFVARYGDWFTLVSAGFPALGTAVFGIRFQGDFGGDALRSLATAQTLGRIEEELRQSESLSRAADLTEQAARIMLSDLDEWRLVNQQRELEFG